MTDIRSKPQAMRPELETLAEATRCQVALELFDLVKVKLAVTKAAKAGRLTYVLRPPVPLDLRGTPAAGKLKEWADKEGLTLDWGTPEPVMEGGFEVARLVPVAVGWGAPRLVVGDGS
ncbi:hypothetical protein NS365_18640 [Aureimonas ureilytica]|uniref:Uncharacterized protein n=1 Tax=Aureimonas ureilytica TaxID=401562 RepID=A0A175RIU4_9HYPH|nr:hypothetical protein [Aureimonas ureilytica]KTR03358.1 hypothetical protein NS365_18640 [Aureimonas ureilytica]